MALTDNLVSYWKLDESSGNAADSVGSNTLTNNGSTTYSTGKINNGAVLNANTKYLSIADASQSGLDLTTAFTFSFWINVTKPTNGVTISFIDKYLGTGNQRSYRLYYYNSSGTYTFYSDLSGDGSGADEYILNYTLTDSTWYHIVYVWNGSTKKHTLYINGSSQGEQTGSLTSSLFNSTAPFYLGNGQGLNTTLNGTMDEVGVWSRALSSTEISQLYNSGNGLQYPFNLNKGNFLIFM